MAMVLQNDPLRRRWIEAQLDEEFRRGISGGIVAFLAFGPGRAAQLAGTGFVVGSSGSDAAVLTAKHVFTEGVSRIQRPMQVHALSTPPEFLSPKACGISADPKKLRAVWFGENTADLCLIHQIHYANSLDIAICTVSHQDHIPDEAKFRSFSLDTSMPILGEEICLLSSNVLNVSNDVLNSNNAAHFLKIEKNICVRLGTVTGVFPEGYRQYKWPCFTTTIPAEPGMSGGLVYRPREGQPIGACGVVSADFSNDIARKNFRTEGQSIIAMIWPSLGYSIPESLPVMPDTNQRTLLELVQSGEIKDVAGDGSNFSISKSEYGGYLVHRRQ